MTTMAMIKPVDIRTSLPLGFARAFPVVAARPNRRLPGCRAADVRSAGPLACTPTARCRPRRWSSAPPRRACELFALTDHDTVDGVPGGGRARRASSGIALSPAAELSAVHGGHEDLHVLGYELDVADPDLVAVLQRLPRRPRAPDRGDGRPPARAGLRARRRAAGRPPRGRQADRAPAPRRRACSPTPPTPQRLRDGGHRTAATSCSRPTSCPGAQAYVARSRPTVAEAIEVIHAAGGVAVWAHPFWDVDAPDGGAGHAGRVRRAPGSTASSASTPPTPRSRPACCTTPRSEHGLLTTGSTDFHGPDHERFSAFRGVRGSRSDRELGPIGGKSGYEGRHEPTRADRLRPRGDPRVSEQVRGAARRPGGRPGARAGGARARGARLPGRADGQGRRRQGPLGGPRRRQRAVGADRRDARAPPRAARQAAASGDQPTRSP